MTEGNEMPYIKEEDRPPIDAAVDNLVKVLKAKGEYNYAMTRLVHEFVKSKPRVCYDSLSEAHGLAQDVAAEFYRVVVAPYEDEKIKQNGAVSDLDGDNL